MGRVVNINATNRQVSTLTGSSSGYSWGYGFVFSDNINDWMRNAYKAQDPSYKKGWARKKKDR